MRSDWKDCTLGEAITLKRGYDLPAKQRRPGAVPIVSSSGVTDVHAESMVKGPGVVTGRYGTIGQVFYVSQDFWPLNTTLYVQDFKGHDKRFVSYLLQTIDYHQFSDKAAVPGVNRNHLHTARIALPPLPEQVRISAVLQSLDDRIALLRQTNATLESIAQALFKSWFVDFDPVRAKAEGREPVGMDASTAELFPSQFEDSALGATPRGWKLVPFGELLGSAIGGDWGSEEQSEECSLSASIIRGTDMPDIRAGFYDRVPRRFVSPKKALKRTLVDGDLVIEVSGGSKTQPTGRSLYVTKNIIERLGGSVVPTSFCRLFRPKDAETGLLLAQHLDAIYREGKMWGYQVQSTGLANFQTQHFLESELVVDAPREVLRAFFALVRPLIDRAEKSPITELAALRDTLLPSLISGKLRLPEAQEKVEDALA